MAPVTRAQKVNDAPIGAALAPRLAPELDAVEQFGYEPICTVYLKYDAAVSIPGGFTALLFAVREGRTKKGR